MNRRRALRWREDAVSPVIATILMVAITVVLAAVLYVLATGLFQGGSPSFPPTIAFVPSPAGTGIWTAELQVDRAVRLSSFRVSLRNVTSSQICIPDTDLAAGFSATCDSGVTLTFEDLASSASAELNGGDTFRLSGIATGNYYTINIVWKQSGSIISSVTLPTS